MIKIENLYAVVRNYINPDFGYYNIPSRCIYFYYGLENAIRAAKDLAKRYDSTKDIIVSKAKYDEDGFLSESLNEEDVAYRWKRGESSK